MPPHFIEESKSNDPKPNALKRLHTLAERSLADLTQQEQQLALGRIRGTGPGVHFGSLIDWTPRIQLPSSFRLRTAIVSEVGYGERLVQPKGCPPSPNSNG